MFRKDIAVRANRSQCFMTLPTDTTKTPRRSMITALKWILSKELAGAFVILNLQAQRPRDRIRCRRGTRPMVVLPCDMSPFTWVSVVIRMQA